MTNGTKSILIGLGGVIVIDQIFTDATGLLSFFAIILGFGVMGYALMIQDKPDE